MQRRATTRKVRVVMSYLRLGEDFWREERNTFLHAADMRTFEEIKRRWPESEEHIAITCGGSDSLFAELHDKQRGVKRKE